VPVEEPAEVDEEEEEDEDEGSDAPPRENVGSEDEQVYDTAYELP
jgi:hypothetical protein